MNIHEGKCKATLMLLQVALMDVNYFFGRKLSNDQIFLLLLKLSRYEFLVSDHPLNKWSVYE